jgi:DNA-binding LytR/AlgR family response regulator
MHSEIREQPRRLRERRPPAVHASRVAAYLKGSGRGWLIALAVGLFLGFSGAFGSGDAPLSTRLPLWIGLMLVGAAMGSILWRITERLPLFENRPLVTSALLAVVMTGPMSLVVWWVVSTIYGLPLRLGTFLYLIPAVLMVSGVMMVLNLLAQRRPPETHAAAEGEAPARFLERLPLKLRGAELYAVEAEDHYLRLHTSRGSDLILMRLADAVAELEGIEGARTHRSWWVAKDAVVDARAADGRAVLTLKDGAEAPVSRTYARSLKQARWW